MDELINTLSGFDVPASGMAAERLRMSVIAENIANASTTRTAAGGPYVRRYVSFESWLDGGGHSGVRATRVQEDRRTPFTAVQDPGHPDADDQGYVQYPNVNSVFEMIDFNIARRSYEANLAVFRAYRDMVRNAINHLAV
jgi:flagellar basal-body rod protein FlgC